LPHVELLDQLDPFYEEVAYRLQHHDNQPKRLLLARARMENSVFEIARQPLGESRQDYADRFLDLLVENSALEREIGVRCGKVKLKSGQRLMEQSITPIQPLARRWLKAADDGSVEFRLARAIASITSWGNSNQSHVGPLRSNLLPLRYKDGRWAWDERSRAAVWSRGAGLFENLAAVLRRRLIDASRVTGEGLPLWSDHGAEFQDILMLWRGEVDQSRLEDLIHALALVDFDTKRNGSGESGTSQERDIQSDDTRDECRAGLDSAPTLPRAYALLKLCFLGGRLPPRPTSEGTPRRTGDEPYPPRALEVLNLLLAGRLSEGLTVAACKHRAKGYPTIVPDSAFRTAEFAMTATETRRIAGLLLVPVRRSDILATLVIKPHQD
jgi:CRISPR-associated protein Csx17